MIFLFAIYVVFEIVTVSAVKSCNRKGESFPKPHRRQTFVEGESITRITRYLRKKEDSRGVETRFYDTKHILAKLTFTFYKETTPCMYEWEY